MRGEKNDLDSVVAVRREIVVRFKMYFEGIENRFIDRFYMRSKTEGSMMNPTYCLKQLGKSSVFYKAGLPWWLRW